MTEGSKLPVQSSPKITKVEKSEKIQDPRRVEAGKRLAAISREPKERKARERRGAAVKNDHEVAN